MDEYQVNPVIGPINGEAEAPGSKSITNRALMLASMARGESLLTNVLFSDDSRGFMDCIGSLGYAIEIDEAAKTVRLTGGEPRKTGSIHVRSAGTAARFITAMLAGYDGEYRVDSSAQMKARPMKPLLEGLCLLGARVDYLEKDGFLPFVLKGCGQASGGASAKLPREVIVDAAQSSQFTSALLMTGCLHEGGLRVKPQGKETARSYIDITLNMMAQFGVCASRMEDGSYLVPPGQEYEAREYLIEPDVSGACYFYAMAALTGGRVCVRNVRLSSMQGDIKFLDVLQEMGCTVGESDRGVWVAGPPEGKIKGVDVNMNDFSDQTLTLAALAPFASAPTTIRGVGHIRYQESNRIGAIVTELEKLGIRTDETDDGLVIYPGTVRPALIETYEDHRMAMAFSLIGLRVEGIRIANPSCTAKTFENYFEELERLTRV